VLFAAALLTGLLATAGPAKAPLEAGLPPGELPKRLGLSQPKFATLEPHPAYAAVYVVIGKRQGGTFRAVLAHFEGGSSATSLRDGKHVAARIGLPQHDDQFVELDLEIGGREVEYTWGATSPPPDYAQYARDLLGLRVAKLRERPQPISELAAPITVVNWWTSWCVPCRAEIPELNALVDELGPGGKVAFLAISPEDRATVREALRKTPFAFEQLVAGSDAAKVLGESFPRHTVLVGDRIAFDFKGYGKATVDTLRKTIRAELAALPADAP
jgi:thiol-disulfide isomerase/thioredoxin